jgi:thiaminase/transcriptional activator TenA
MSRSLFSREAWGRNAAIYEAIRTMPFNAQLASGSLSEARFKHYITHVRGNYVIDFCY